MIQTKAVLQLWCETCKRNERLPVHRMPDEFEGRTQAEAFAKAQAAGWYVGVHLDDVRCPDCAAALAVGNV